MGSASVPAGAVGVGVGSEVGVGDGSVVGVGVGSAVGVGSSGTQVGSVSTVQ